MDQAKVAGFPPADHDLVFTFVSRASGFGPISSRRVRMGTWLGIDRKTARRWIARLEREGDV